MVGMTRFGPSRLRRRLAGISVTIYGLEIGMSVAIGR